MAEIDQIVQRAGGLVENLHFATVVHGQGKHLLKQEIHNKAKDVRIFFFDFLVVNLNRFKHQICLGSGPTGANANNCSTINWRFAPGARCSPSTVLVASAAQ